jgi:mediator of RNA polymerase II transcription subunit 12, fungi type
MVISFYILVEAVSLTYLNSFLMNFVCSLKLLRTFYAEDLVDHRTFLTWLTQQMITCNLAQSGFLACLAEEYLDDIIASRALARPLVEGCLAKLMEARTK